MSTTKTTPEKATVSSGMHSLPAVICFDGDTLAHTAVAACQRYGRLKYADLEGRDAETIVVVSSERLLAQYQPLLRAPNIRIIGLSNTRYKDARLDGAVYGYLPLDTPPLLVERMMDNALDHIHLLATRRDANERLDRATREISELNAIGAALSAEHGTETLLEMILEKSREITKSDAGSLYLVEELPLDAELPEAASAKEDVQEYGGAKLAVTRKDGTKKVLRFKLAQNYTLRQVPFREAVMEISDKSIAGYVVRTGEIVNLDDAYHLPGPVPYSFNRKFDEDSGYRTKSMIAVPMRNPKTGEIVGAVQLINAKRQYEAKLNSLSAVVSQVVPYTVRQQEMVASLASQAAVALENSRLYERQQELFKGFVKASVKAIELRDPTTRGHSERVRNLTVALAQTLDRASDGPYKDLKFTRDQIQEIDYASLLHDVGKVSVPEKVLVKAKKLFPEHLENLQQRFQVFKARVQVEWLRSTKQYILEKGREDYLAREAEFEALLDQQCRQVDGYLAAVLQSNEPTVLPEGNFDKLTEVAGRRFVDFNSVDQSLLTPQEVRLLSIRKGSLNEEEWEVMKSHVLGTFEFLEQIPWTRQIQDIPEIARGHHEKLNGQGYPHKLLAPDIPLQTRMMTISDIFDALAANDRPYKRAVSTEKALQIVQMEVDEGNLDPNLFRVFKEAKIWEHWRQEPSPY